MIITPPTFVDQVEEKFMGVNRRYSVSCDLKINEKDLKNIDSEILIDSQLSSQDTYLMAMGHNMSNWKPYFSFFSGDTLIAQIPDLIPYGFGNWYYVSTPSIEPDNNYALYYISIYPYSMLWSDGAWIIMLERLYEINGEYVYRVAPEFYPTGFGTAPELPNTLTFKYNMPDAWYDETIEWLYFKKFNPIYQSRLFIKTQNETNKEKYKLLETGLLEEVVPAIRNESQDVEFISYYEILTKYTYFDEFGFIKFSYTSSGIIFNSNITKLAYQPSNINQIQLKLLVSEKNTQQFKERQKLAEITNITGVRG